MTSPPPSSPPESTSSSPPTEPPTEAHNNNPLLPFSPRHRDTSGPFKSPPPNPLSDRSNISEPDSLPEVSSYLAALAQLERDAIGGMEGWYSSDEESDGSEESEWEEEEDRGEQEREEESREAEDEVMRKMIGIIRMKLGRPKRLERVEEEDDDEEEE